MKSVHRCRPFAQADYASLARIHDAARKLELVAAGLEKAFLPFSVAAEREQLFDYDIILAEKNDEVEGFVAYESGELAWLYVDPVKQGLGVGTLLTEYAIKHAGPTVTVEVLVGNLRARQLYERLGFVLQGTESGRMPGNEDFQVTAWILALNRGEASGP